MSYTRSHPVAHRFKCDTCKMELAGDNMPAVTVALWRGAHDDAGHDVIETHTIGGAE